ncbi:MAG: hypothetical protein Q7S92_06535 [Candidatus Diapherotrites archaeon]|nr:hypothetical protein [Candidatus Diapherotrites archaeon]
MKKFHFFVLVQFLLFAFIPVVFAQTNTWDALRPLTEFAKNIDLPVKVIVFLISFALLGIAFLAWQKAKSSKFFFIALAFFFFAFKWALKVADAFLSPGYFFSDPAQNVLELLIFASLFLALFKK